MSVAHVLYIPCVLFVGIAVGYIMGIRAARSEIERRRTFGADDDDL